MNIYSTLSKEHSKEQCDRIVQYVGSDPKKMKELMQCFFSKEKRICQRASWPLNSIARKNPFLLTPYHQKMIENLDNAPHDAVIRNTVRIYESIVIPESIEGHLFEKCFDYLNNPKMAIAIRAFSITILEKLVVQYPELKHELISVLEEHIPHGSAGFKNRATKCLHRLRNS